MPRGGTGTYTLPVGTQVTAGTTIESNWANTLTDDLETALTDSLSRSGNGGMQAPLSLVDGTAGAPAFGFSSEATTGFYLNAAGDMRASVAGTERLALSASRFDLRTTAFPRWWNTTTAAWEEVKPSPSAGGPLVHDNAANVGGKVIITNTAPVSVGSSEPGDIWLVWV